MAKNKKNSEKTRYSDEELQEFKTLITEKLERAKAEFDRLQEQTKSLADNPESKVGGIEDGISTSEKEYLNNMAGRQMQYMKHLENALIRIENKVYGICRQTGKLISKERLRAVPHATLSIDAKKSQSSHLAEDRKRKYDRLKDLTK